MAKSSKVYIRKPCGTIVRLDSSRHPTLNSFLLSKSQEINNRFKAMGKEFKPDTIQVPEPYASIIKMELSLNRITSKFDKLRKILSVSASDPRLIVLYLEL